jgi:hypothetical protein
MTTLETRPATAPPTGTPYDQLTVVPARHPGRWVATAVVAVLLAMVVNRPARAGLMSFSSWPGPVPLAATGRRAAAAGPGYARAVP